LAENPYHNINQWLGRIAKENQQGNINKDECVNIVKKLSLKTYEAERKVMVIWMAEYLGKEGNRLLKLIEEPPPNTHFILIAENQDLILNTILSRCQLVQFQALSDEEIVQGLTGRLQVSKEQAETAALLADGNYNEAQQLVQEVESDFSGCSLFGCGIATGCTPVKYCPGSMNLCN
jgi:DNA polymerase-3 subunit delta'